MDIQETMEFILEHEAKLHVQMQELTQKMNGLAHRMDEGRLHRLEMEERHDREMSEIRAVTVELRADLRRAVRLSVEEQRRERVRRQELDEKMTQLAAAQVTTEEKLQRLIDTLNQPRNGNRQ